MSILWYQNGCKCWSVHCKIKTIFSYLYPCFWSCWVDQASAQSLSPVFWIAVVSFSVQRQLCKARLKFWPYHTPASSCGSFDVDRDWRGTQLYSTYRDKYNKMVRFLASPETTVVAKTVLFSILASVLLCVSSNANVSWTSVDVAFLLQLLLKKITYLKKGHYLNSKLSRLVADWQTLACRSADDHKWMR